MVASVEAMVRPVCAALSLVTSVMLVSCSAVSDASAPCPEVTDVSAWVNRMPGAGGRPAKLHVLVRVADDQSWMLSPVVSAEEGVLRLFLSPGGPSVPGTAAYQQKSAPMPEQVKIECHGKIVASVKEIMTTF
ncbi:hypothetical protein [Hyphomonas pacifica]|uniref:Uncharacterized protein n=1 Tax=Hyphomonas pacifica TaxID=1280941 RepID=A0A062TVM2_9PROT|nr:hypothetical protein [Hyphomonas pacifica]KCZ49355.1 hypothetical protein HY2_02940 [Hyphomonas pacifica]RAN33161.1 hypothetical protein HY3_02105 [Hyphomonas pacifica]